MTAPTGVEPPASLEQERQGDRRVLLLTAGSLLVAFSIGAAVQTVFVFAPERVNLAALGGDLSELSVRLGINLLTVVIFLLVCALVRPDELPLRIRVPLLVAVSVGASLFRFWTQLGVGIYVDPPWSTFFSEVLSAIVVGMVSTSLGVAQANARKRLRTQERANARQELLASAALAALTTEELRVRREVAEELHGTLQNQLVLVEVQLDSVIGRSHDGPIGESDLALLSRVRSDLDEIRERDVRQLSQLLYPAGVELGIAHAIRLLVKRIPATIAVEVALDERLGSASNPDGLAVASRVALVRAAEEGITNALRHGGAASIRLELAVEEDGPMVRLSVDDDGRGLGEGAVRWNGLARLAERAESLGGTLRLGASTRGGTRLSVLLPFS